MSKGHEVEKGDTPKGVSVAAFSLQVHRSSPFLCDKICLNGLCAWRGVCVFK